MKDPSRLSILLERLEDIESKLEIGHNTSGLIAGLLKMDMFAKGLEKSAKLDSEQINRLSHGTAEISIAIIAKNICLTIVRQNIAELIRAISEIKNHDIGSKASEATNEAKHLSKDHGQDVSLGATENHAEKVDIFQKDEAPLDKKFKNVADFYSSYFSNSAIKQLSQHLRTGQVPPSLKKYLTVCFIDLVGFSTMSEVYEAEKVVHVLNFFFNQVNTTIQSYGGDIDKFLGDALLITFESAESAIRCAAEIILKDIDIMNLKLDYMGYPELKIHVGINTGWIVQTYVGSKYRREITVIGDGVNIAARVQSIAPPNQLWATSITTSSLGSLKLKFKQVGRKKLKGRMQEVMIYQYIRSVPDNHSILLIEPDRTTYIEIVHQMNELGIKIIVPILQLKEIPEQLTNKEHKAVVVGPGVELSKYKDIINMIDENCSWDMPLIPIIRKKIDQDTLRLFEKIHLSNYVPMYKEDGMERLLNVLVNNHIKEIERRTDEPKPEMSEKVDGDTYYKKLKSGEHEKLSIAVENDVISLHVFDLLKTEELALLKNDLNDLWQYSLHHQPFTFIYNFEGIKPEIMNNIFLNNLLSVLDFNPNPEQITVKVKFHGNDVSEDWEFIKANYAYQFET